MNKKGVRSIFFSMIIIMLFAMSILVNPLSLYANPTPFANNATPSAEIPDGIYFIRVRGHELFLDVQNGNRGNGVRIWLWYLNRSTAQQWRFERQANGAYKIFAMHSGRQMAVSGASFENGARVYQWDDHDYLNHQWFVYHAGNGYFEFVNANSGLALDVSGGDFRQRTFMQQWERLDNNNQRFRLVPHPVGTCHAHMAGEFQVLSEATCIREGVRISQCIFCDTEIRETTPMTGHVASGNWVVINQGTCTQDGHRVQYCRFCPDVVVLSETIPGTGHTPSGEWITLIEATCSNVGQRVQYCEGCGEVAISQDIPLLPHVPYGDWFITREPTCTVEGEEARVCETCGGAAITRSIQRLPHTPSGNWVYYEIPDCNTPGRRVQYCTISGSIAIDEVIPAITGLDHAIVSQRVSGNVFIPPIITEYVCEVCGYDGGHSTSFAFAWVSPSILAGVLIIGIIIIKTMRKVKKNKKFVCPFCFEEHLVRNVQFRCANLKCEDVDDVELTKYENDKSGLPLQRKRTFPSPITKNYSIPKNASCPDCGRKTSKVICPSCHNNLPESSLVGEDMIISIVGSRNVGKSHFIGVIINELIERVAGRFGGALTGFDDTTARYEQNFGRNLYVELRKLDITQSSLINTNNGAYRPLIYSLTISKNKKTTKYTLVFFDTAGEDLNTFDTMNTVNRYICKSAGIIFLLDPMQIWAVRNQLDEDIVSRATSVSIQDATRPDDIMTRVSELIRNDKNMDSSKKIDVPVAAVFSKFDIIIPLIPQGSTIFDPSPHCDAGDFVMSDWHNVNAEIQSLLKTWGATAFVQQLELNYSNFSYFATSSLGLGNNPRRDDRIDRPRPHRIEDALLWILSENGIINKK